MKSYSKLRHIQEANNRLESRYLMEQPVSPDPEDMSRSVDPIVYEPSEIQELETLKKSLEEMKQKVKDLKNVQQTQYGNIFQRARREIRNFKVSRAVNKLKRKNAKVAVEIDKLEKKMDEIENSKKGLTPQEKSNIGEVLSLLLSGIISAIALQLLGKELPKKEPKRQFEKLGTVHELIPYEPDGNVQPIPNIINKP